jgi:hypothetical protein
MNDKKRTGSGGLVPLTAYSNPLMKKLAEKRVNHKQQVIALPFYPKRRR